MSQNSRPGDLIGRDMASGQIRIDRVVPVTWLFGIVAAAMVQAASMYYGQKEIATNLLKLSSEVATLQVLVTSLSVRDAEQATSLSDLRRRVDYLEQKVNK